MENTIEKHALELGSRLAGKYLSFLLSDEVYVIDISHIQEIIQVQKVSSVPNSPDFIRGILNLRGKVIPVIELRAKFNIEKITDTQKTVIVVLELRTDKDNSVIMGIIIDEVKEVLDIPAKDIEKTPNLGKNVNTDFIMGVCKSGNSIKMLLNIAKVLSIEDLHHISQL